MSTKYWLYTLGAVAVLGASCGAWFFSHETVKTVNVDHDVVHDQIVTVTKTIKQPTGVVETDTTVTDSKTSDDTDTKTTVAPSPTPSKKWIVSGTYGMGINSIPAYGVEVQYRLIGPVIVGVQGDTSARGLVTLGIEF